jgi:flagellar M-ring protein FliF
MKPLLLLVGVAAAVAAGVFITLWSRGPTYSLLYSSLSSSDQASIAQALDSAAIPYRLESSANGISVAADKINEARLKLAGQGLPEGGGGFATMNKDPGFGLSQFMENARYQHVLETELARTIASLSPVEGARVHLAVPRQSAFVRDRQPASASVFVQLKAGRRLEPGQVQSVVNLVASSIPELDAKQVTVVDQQGRLLSAPQGNDEVSQREQQFEMAHRLEDDYAQRIQSLLEPFVGSGRVRAQVVAQLDNSVNEEAREQYRPNSQIVRNEQTSEQTSSGANGPQGVPGSLTNQPPAAGTALPPAPATAAATPPASGTQTAAQAAAAAAAAAAANATPENTSHEASRNYEIDRTLAYTRQPSGRLQRLTVAVLIDNVRTATEDGKGKETPISAEQLARITMLVKDAVGFNAERGDSVNVVNSSFRQEEAPPEEEVQSVPLWEKPLVQNMIKLGLGAIVLLILIFMVIRPLVKGLLEASRSMPASVAQAEAAAHAAMASNLNQPLAHEQQLTQARTMVGQDPKRVAQVVRTWVGQDG